MKSQLSKITSTQLASTGSYKTLADIGIATNRDGTLTLEKTLAHLRSLAAALSP